MSTDSKPRMYSDIIIPQSVATTQNLKIKVVVICMVDWMITQKLYETSMSNRMDVCARQQKDGKLFQDIQGNFGKIFKDHFGLKAEEKRTSSGI